MEVIFYKYYFPREVAVYWYSWFKKMTGRFYDRELWSWVGQSKLTQLFPKSIIQKMLKKRLLAIYKKGFLTDSDGAQLFMIAQKI